MASITLFVCAACAAGLLYMLRGLASLVLRQYRSPLHKLPGPSCTSRIVGNLKEMHNQENTGLFEQWRLQHGSSFAYSGFLGGPRLMTFDPVAVAHILGNAYDYPKPSFIRDGLAAMGAGDQGLLTTEGEVHKKQRKILSPAFSPTSLRSLSPIFWDKARQLRDIWAELSDSPKPQRIDALSYLSRAMLDIIGLAGFGYRFDVLGSDDAVGHTELAKAFGVIFSTSKSFKIMAILQEWFPVLRIFRRNSGTMATAKANMRRIGLQLIDERQQAAADEMSGKAASIVGEKTVLGKDILSVLIRSSLAKAPTQQMNREEILCQISTFMAAGHETTANAVTWCLYALVTNPDTQRKLRTELQKLGVGVGADRIEDAVMQCEYLDWVVKETLRLHSPVTTTMRVCQRDEDEIPVDVTDGGYLDRSGVVRHSIRVKKGDIITIPIQAINKSVAFWGDDANSFRPERWAKPFWRSKSIPGLYSNVMTFLNGNTTNGNRSCIGYQFALFELKIFLYVLVTDLEFSIDPTTIIEKQVNVITRPFVKSEPALGNQLPIYIKRV
ncbi:cytochrome P450 [Cylindrobasidium torrendii FP15055 ss-10]|uniref:Cytochrome P450 n=1 Tax=Cylindrobasidium torrendii FP15055 ss-10 TaxID=1314674 RepID=A0A0D7BNI9_9AGAR|nr:cytochrome P450 [Cylindrobasidium torrendii FP15055 ss-10]